MRFHDVQQNSEAWEALRIGKVTGSNAGYFMANLGKQFGDPAKKYAVSVALERINQRKTEGYSNAHMERGHEQEPVARMLYEEQNFIDVDNGGFFDCGLHGDSPDGLVGADGVVEIKSVIASTHYANLTRKAPDPAYKWQYVTHLDCTGRDWVDFVSYCSEFPESQQLIVYRITRDSQKEQLEQLAERREKFLHLIDEVEHNIRSAA